MWFIVGFGTLIGAGIGAGGALFLVVLFVSIVTWRTQRILRARPTTPPSPEQVRAEAEFIFNLEGMNTMLRGNLIPTALIIFGIPAAVGGFLGFVIENILRLF